MTFRRLSDQPMMLRVYLAAPEAGAIVGKQSRARFLCNGSKQVFPLRNRSFMPDADPSRGVILNCSKSPISQR
jgi:hypothetical protein